MNFTFNELLLAYRKAKVDKYYSSHASLINWAAYEEHLYDNLNSLLSRINGDSDDWINDLGFLGGWKLVPKKLDMPTDHADGFVYGSASARWEHLINSKKKDKRIEAQFRLMAECTVDFHVLSTLWIMKVGEKFDNLLSNNSYGNRLRRDKNGAFNPLSLGSFKPYLQPFQNWRDNGIRSVQNAIENNKQVVALTTDISSFYHELDARFILRKSFTEHLGKSFSLTADEEKLNKLFIHSVENWANKTPSKKGLPVGLPCLVYTSPSPRD